MNNHGLRRVISMLLAVVMVCTLLPTATFAEATGGPGPTQQSETLSSNTQTPTEAKDVPAAAEASDGKETPQTQAGDAKEEAPAAAEGEKPQEPAKAEKSADEKGGVATQASYNSAMLTLRVSSYGAPFLNGSTGQHTVNFVNVAKSISRSDAGSNNPKGSATARFVGSNETGWALVVDLVVGNYKETITTSARITNKDMSAATGTVTFGLSFNSAGGTSTTVSISGARPLPSTAPSAPGKADIQALLGGNVAIYCTNTGAAHASKTYSLNENTISVGDVQGSEGNYTCTVTVDSAEYVKRFNAETGAEHTPVSASKSFTLKYNGTSWTGGSTVSFDVACVTKPAVPAVPGVDEIPGILGDSAVLVCCTNQDEEHAAQTYALENGTFDVSADVQGDETSGYYCMVAIHAQTYVEKYSAAVGKDHTAAHADKTIRLNYVDGKWTASHAVPVAFEAACVTEVEPTNPELPEAPDVEMLLANGAVKISCSNANGSHEDRTYALLEGDYQVGDVQADGNGGYVCTVTVFADKHVAQYNEDVSDVAHLLDDAASKTITLKYDGMKWTVDGDPAVAFSVECIVEELTVTYADGANGQVFADEVHSGLKVGSETPAFEGKLTREGYVFAGWTPEVADFVTESTTYTATWKKVFPVSIVLYRNGDTTKAYKTISLGKQPQGTVLDLTALNIGDYYTANYTGKYDFYGWYNDGLWGTYKKNPANAPAGLEKITVSGWTNINAMVYDHEKVIYFQSAEGLSDFQNDHSNTSGLLLSTTARKGTALPTADAPVPTRTGYHFLFWSREGQGSDVTGQTLGGWTNLYANWEKNIYTVTYTDGVDGEEVFADQVYNVPFEDATPAFEGEPTREGYVFAGWTPEVAETVTDNVTYVATWKKLCPVSIVIYRNGDTTKAYKTFSLAKQPQGTVLNLTELNIGDYYTANYTGKYDFYGWYNDGLWNTYKKNPANAPAGLEKITVNGWTNLSAMVYDYEKVVYFQSAEDLSAYQNDHSNAAGLLLSTTARHGSALPTADAPVPTRTGYHFLFWSREGQSSDVTGQTLGGWTNLYANWEKNIYTVTYTDGVEDEEVFADQVYNVPFEDATPAFEGEPTREGYVFAGWTPEVAETVTDNVTYVATWKKLCPVSVVIYRNGDTAKAYKTFSLGKQPQGTVLDLTALNIGDYYTANYSGKYDAYGWYNDGQWNVYKQDPANAPAGLEKITVNGWTNIIAMVYDYEKVVYFQSAEDLAAYQADHSKTDGLLYTATVRNGSALPTADAPAAVRTGYHFLFWSREGQTSDVTGQTVGGWTNLYANWEKNIYTVTYTDGVEDGEVFADQVYNVPFEDATPDFQGELTREGYVFGGWDPEVAGTVTETVTYAAVWKEDVNGNGIADEKEPKYTVVYTDGVEDEEVFADQRHEGLLSGLATPAFQGELTRKGYVFGGWNPEVTETVTGSVTYTAVWKVDSNNNGIADDEEEKYTVTYTDGVENAEVFADQVHENLLSGTATPAFSGETTRKGYIFGGWDPKVADTVTETVTYTATWKEDANNNGIPDDEEEKYTVTYTDGAKGKAFADQVYSGLLSGSLTPAFDGVPTHKGYVFTGWSPKIDSTVSKDVTYTATWKAVKATGKDNVPKTGDKSLVLVMGGVMLFSLCGAVAVSVYDRKRRQG